MSGSDLAERLVVELRKRVPDGEVTRYATRAGLSMEHLMRLRKGKNSDIRLSTLEALAKACGTSPEVLLGIAAEKDADLAVVTTRGGHHYAEVPVMADPVCAGPGAQMTEEVEDEPHAMRSDWVAMHGGARLRRVRVSRTHHLGESMASTILPGAVLTVEMRLHSAADIKPHSIYLVRDEDHGVAVKRVVVDPSRKCFLCISDNKVFPVYEVYPKQGGAVIAHVLRWEQGEENHG